MIRILSLLISLALAMDPARAQASQACEFVSRNAAGLILSEMPQNIIGWMNCSGRTKEVNVFLVMKVNDLSELTLTKLVTEHAKRIDITAATTTVTWQSKQPLTNRQMMVRTVSAMNSAGEKIAMSHYAFVVTRKDGSQVVLIHSMDEDETNKVKNTLNDLNRRLTSQLL